MKKIILPFFALGVLTCLCLPFYYFLGKYLPVFFLVLMSVLGWCILLISVILSYLEPGHYARTFVRIFSFILLVLIPLFFIVDVFIISSHRKENIYLNFLKKEASKDSLNKKNHYLLKNKGVKTAAVTWFARPKKYPTELRYFYRANGKIYTNSTPFHYNTHYPSGYYLLRYLPSSPLVHEIYLDSLLSDSLGHKLVLINISKINRDSIVNIDDWPITEEHDSGNVPPVNVPNGCKAINP